VDYSRSVAHTSLLAFMVGSVCWD